MMEPKLYLKNNSLQNELAKKFCQELTLDPDWSESRLETVMDVGCGPGNTSAYWIDHYFPKIEQLIGIDIDPGMIKLSSDRNTKKKIEYYVADIMKKKSLQKWEGRIDRILSNLVFHRIPDQRLAFKNVFDLLKPEGIACVKFIAKSPFYNACKDLMKITKWKSLLEATNLIFPESMAKCYDVKLYKQMFKDIGFRVDCCYVRQIANFSYSSDEQCKNHLLSLHCIGDVPEELKQEYKEDLFRQFLKYSPRDSDGHPTHNSSVLHAKLVKEKLM